MNLARTQAELLEQLKAKGLLDKNDNVEMKEIPPEKIIICGAAKDQKPFTSYRIKPKKRRAE